MNTRKKAISILIIHLLPSSVINNLTRRKERKGKHWTWVDIQVKFCHKMQLLTFFFKSVCMIAVILILTHCNFSTQKWLNIIRDISCLTVSLWLPNLKPHTQSTRDCLLICCKEDLIPTAFSSVSRWRLILCCFLFFDFSSDTPVLQFRKPPIRNGTTSYLQWNGTNNSESHQSIHEDICLMLIVRIFTEV